MNEAGRGLCRQRPRSEICVQSQRSLKPHTPLRFWLMLSEKSSDRHLLAVAEKNQANLLWSRKARSHECVSWVIAHPANRPGLGHQRFAQFRAPTAADLLWHEKRSCRAGARAGVSTWKRKRGGTPWIPETDPLLRMATRLGNK